MIKNREIAFNAITIAIVILLTIIKPLGYPIIGPISATTVHIPILIAIGYYKKLPQAIMFGLVFGISSMISNALVPSLFSPLFLNPLISVLPRVAMAIVAYFAFKKFTAPIAAFIGSYANSLFVLGALGLIYKSKIEFMSFPFWPWVQGIIISNALVEAVMAAIIVSALLKIFEKKI